jgi:hypothetical protein
MHFFQHCSMTGVTISAGSSPMGEKGSFLYWLCPIEKNTSSFPQHSQHRLIAIKPIKPTKPIQAYRKKCCHHSSTTPVSVISSPCSVMIDISPGTVTVVTSILYFSCTMMYRLVHLIGPCSSVRESWSCVRLLEQTYATSHLYFLGDLLPFFLMVLRLVLLLF